MRIEQGLTNVRFHWEPAEGKATVICMLLELFENLVGLGVIPRTARDQVNPPAGRAGSDMD